MALGTVLSVAQTLFAALQCTELKEMCSILGYKSELDQLSKTVSTIRAVFLDAESKQDELSHEAQLWIQELKDAVYDADDLLDEFLTLTHQKKLMEGGKVSKEVRRLFSRFNPLGVAYKMSQGVKKIRKKLDAIASNHTQFGLTIDHKPIRKRREETCSYVYANNIIGREADTKNIVGILLDSDVQRDVSFLTIVGVGGLGKTTLAQLVYNHGEVQTEFGLRLWACVSDHDQEKLDLKSILCKVLESATGRKHDESSMDRVQSQLREQLRGKKYLLVLDDVWNENRDEWVKLVDFFMGGQRGSWIVVTTRSEETARVIGNGPTYPLEGLSEEDSWCLFERTAFEEVEERPKPSDLVDIGYEIVKRCANNPLVIRVVGSLLYGQNKSKWLSFRELRLSKIRQGGNDIMSVLKFSYDHLEPSLRTRFTYCALFPKDFVINKEMLISLWMAQGYIQPFDEDQNIEDTGEEYFLILLRRCFFQEIKVDDYGDIISCKIHDLMHDIAQEVAGKEICVTHSITHVLDEKIRHLSVRENICVEKSLSKTKIRTYFRVTEIGHRLQVSPIGESHVDTLISCCTTLRAFDLHQSGIKSLPSTIDKLVHLRYLDFSANYPNDELKVLPRSITKLHNLETLRLAGCRGLKELPKDLSKLVKLRVLDIEGCKGLTYMLVGMSKLGFLQKLPMFVVTEENPHAKQCVVDQLKELKTLTNLKGYLKIRITKNPVYTKEKGGERGYLRNKQYLSHIKIVWEQKECERVMDDEDALLEDLQPHPNLKGLGLKGYEGVRMPSWARGETLESFLPNLVRIVIKSCRGLQDLPLLGKLLYLKCLEVDSLSNLEYMENRNTTSTNSEASSTSGSTIEELELFPSLKELTLRHLPKLKGWWRGVERVGDDHQLVGGGGSSRQPRLLPSFPILSALTIIRCPELTCIPLCPSVESLCLYHFNERLEIINKRGWDPEKEGGTTTAISSSHPHPHPAGNWRRVTINNMGWLKSLPIESFHRLTHMQISWQDEVESLTEEEVGEVFRVCSSSLRSLDIRHCHKLRSLSGGGLEHLTALEALVIWDVPNLEMTSEEEDGGMPWRSLSQGLRSLGLLSLPQLVNLPNGMQYLTGLKFLSIADCSNLEGLPPWIGCLSSLHSLDIHDCRGVESMPESMRRLTSLRQLEVRWCSKVLEERCRELSGEDWPNIQHIPSVTFRNVVDNK